MKKLLLFGLMLVLLASSVFAIDWYDGIYYYDFEGSGRETGNLNYSEDMSGGTGLFQDTGLLGSSLYGDGSSYMSNTTLTNASHVRTIEFWMQPNVTNDRVPLGIVKDGTNWYVLGIFNNNLKSRLYIGGSNAFEHNGATTIVAGQTYHVVILFGTGGHKVYLNNSLEINQADTDTIPSDFSKIYVGANGGGGDIFTGFVDNILMTQERYTTDNISSAYNSGMPQNYTYLWYETGAATPGVYSISVVLDEPINNTINNTATINFSYTPTETNLIIQNCSLYINDTVNQTNLTITNATLNYFYDVGLNDGHYNWSVSCWSNNSDMYNSSTRLVRIDSVQPTITSILSTGNVLTLEGNNLNVWINATDPNLYSLLINDTTTGLIFNITGINETLYNYSLDMNISNHSVGANQIMVTAADGHTAKTIKEWDFSKNIFSKKITFDFSTGWWDNKYLAIEPKDTEIGEDFFVEKKPDRYIYKLYKKSSKDKVKFTVTSSDIIDIRHDPTGTYKAWLINPNLKKWTDFNIKNPTGLETYDVKRVSEKEVDVTISNLDDRTEVIFESSGDLNVNQVTYTWYKVNYTVTEPSYSIEKTTTIFYLNLTKNNSDITSNATFYYNGASYNPTLSSSSNEDIYNVTIQHAATEIKNSSYLGEWIFNISKGSQINNGSYFKNATLYQIYLDLCGNDTNATAHNYTLYDGPGINKLTNFSFVGSYSLSDPSNPSFTRNYSFSETYVVPSSNRVCVYPEFAKYDVDYDLLFSKTGYTSRSLTDPAGYVNQTTQYFNLYMPATSDTTAITINVIDEDDDALFEYLVEAWLYNVAGDNYTQIDTETVDSEGQVLFNLETGENQYRFIVKNPSGTVVHTQPKQKLIQTEYTFQIVIGSQPELTSIKVSNLDIDLTKNRAQQFFSLVWNNIDGVASQLMFRVENITLNTTSLLYQINYTAASGSLIYNLSGVPTNVSATYVATVSVIAIDDNRTYFVDKETLDYREAWDVFGDDALLVAWLFIGTMIFVGISLTGHPAVGAIIMLIFAEISFIAMGFVVLSMGGAVALVTALIVYLIMVKVRN